MCGWCKDQFGVSWQIVPSILGSLMSDPANAGKNSTGIYENESLILPN